MLFFARWASQLPMKMLFPLRDFNFFIIFCDLYHNNVFCYTIYTSFVAAQFCIKRQNIQFPSTNAWECHRLTFFVVPKRRKNDLFSVTCIHSYLYTSSIIYWKWKKWTKSTINFCLTYTLYTYTIRISNETETKCISCRRQLMLTQQRTHGRINLHFYEIYSDIQQRVKESSARIALLYTSRTVKTKNEDEQG